MIFVGILLAAGLTGLLSGNLGGGAPAGPGPGSAPAASAPARPGGREAAADLRAQAARLAGTIGSDPYLQGSGPAAVADSSTAGAGADADEESRHLAAVNFDNAGYLPRYGGGAGTVRGVEGDNSAKLARLDLVEPERTRIPGTVPFPSEAVSGDSNERDALAVGHAFEEAGAPFAESLRFAQGFLADGTVDILRRNEWDNRPPALRARHSPGHITVHHSQGHEAHSEGALAAIMQSIKWQHQHKKGWSDFAYHYAVAGNGEVAEGRAADRVGSHTKNYNTGNLGIVFLGDFRRDAPDGPQVLAFINLAVEQSVRWNMDVDAQDFMRGHREWNRTDCPGGRLFQMLPQIREIVRRRVRERRAGTLVARA